MTQPDEKHRIANETGSLFRSPGEKEGAIDVGITAWHQGIEHTVDGYIRAWEETSKELMRPQGTRFSPGGDVTEPLRQWVKCWGQP